MDKTCVSCKKIFTPRPAVKNQQYCSKPECQKARKKKWQKAKLATDSAYKESQAKAQKEWCSKNKGYWKEYRKRNPAYTERNRKKQRQRNLLRRLKPEIAKMDEQKAKNVITPGRYLLKPVCNQNIAKMDALIVEIGVISRGCSVAV
ncbi:MAG TPA: hypothetical protein DCP92_21785 [Nitrospiraceae bacterium]|jgi:hypothetical protein|nr:hypothetical protein [Nitrospiraceae bacterium]